jgi:hypothetical protein
MNARHTMFPNLRAALEMTAARVTALLVALAATAALAGIAGATVRPYPEVRSDFWADGTLVDVQLRVDGEAAPLYLSPKGDRRHYFEAFAGRNYSVVLRNNSPRRIGVLLTVDGLNVVNGEITRRSPNEPMYVLDPWESATIQGWRTSLNDVRRFVFVDEKRSYAERTGQANSDMGWIRVLAFREKTVARIFNWKNEQSPDLPWRDTVGEREQRSKNEPEAVAPRAGADKAPAPTLQRMDESSQEKSMAGLESQGSGGSYPGTGWGDRRIDRVNYVNFTPERTAVDQLVFRYEYARGLVALGIYPDRNRLRERDRGGMVGFAKPPRW